jgi:ketosteroid isomerase-like protein
VGCAHGAGRQLAYFVRHFPGERYQRGQGQHNCRSLLATRRMCDRTGQRQGWRGACSTRSRVGGRSDSRARCRAHSWIWADDATIFPPNAPAVHGKAAIRDYVHKSLAIPGFQIHWRPAGASISRDGTLGYTTGENAVTVPGPEGKLITITGRYATVWRRDPVGDWKCVIDIWNSGS